LKNYKLREDDMKLHGYRNVVLALAGFAGLTIGRAAQAQLPKFHPSFYASAEADARNSQFYLLGMYVGMGGLGWSPYFNVSAYSLHYRFTSATNSDSTLSAVSPTLGIAYAGRRQGISFGGGYTWVDHEDPGAPGAEGGGSNGATASIGAYHSGSGRSPTHTQLLSNYNFGSKYFWARGRASVPFGYLGRQTSRIGAEIVGQGGGKNGRKSNSFQAGPTLEYAWTPNFRTTGVIGYKSVGGEILTERQPAAYFKLEGSFSP
jgi:hypothetical protein